MVLNPLIVLVYSRDGFRETRSSANDNKGIHFV